MRKKTVLIIAVVILAVAGIFLVYNEGKKTSFNEVLINQVPVDNIDRVEITRTDETGKNEELKVTDQNEIKNIINSFENVNLKKTRNHELENEKYLYKLNIVVNKEYRFVIYLLDSKTVRILDEKNSNVNDWYEITDGSIAPPEQYFK